MRRLGLVFFCAATVAAAGEYAVLANGAVLRVDRHEADGAKVRLYHDGGLVEMDAALVKSFEPAASPDQAPIPAAQPPALPVAAAEPLPVSTVFELADAAADKYGLPRSLVRSVMAVESGNRPGAISPKGAIGLMQ